LSKPPTIIPGFDGAEARDRGGTACPFAGPVTGSRENPARIDVAGGAFFDRSHELYAELRERGAVARARFHLPEPPEGEAPPEDDDDTVRTAFVEEFWLVTRYDEAVQVLQDDARLSVDPGLEPGDPEDDLFSRSLLTLDPPDHTRLRKLVQPWFAGPAMDALRPRIERIAHDLLDRAEAAAERRGERSPDRAMELVDAFAYPLPVTVISDMLGIPEPDRDRVRGWTEELLHQRARNPTRRRRREQRRFVDYFRQQVARRREEPGDDLVSFLVEAEDQGDRLDEDELLGLMFLLFVAGHITTVNLIANAVAALLRWPDQHALVRSDPSLVRNLVEETLRFWGPVENSVPRVAREAMDLCGVQVEAGDRISAGLGAAGRDPARFTDPDRFDVTRAEAKRHIAFGRGIHTCLGAPLARLEGAIALGVLLERYPDLRSAVPVDALGWKSMFLRGFDAVPVRF
jgi:cytochrome P450